MISTSDRALKSDQGRAFVLAVVGGGPRSTYALERLAHTAVKRHDLRFELQVFDASGDFGAGQVHSPHQPPSSTLNRVASQIVFAADESIASEHGVRPPEQRWTLRTWANAKFEDTKDPRYIIPPDDWAPRSLHGLALVEHFRQFVAELNVLPGVHVELHAEEVLALVTGESNELILRTDARSIAVDHVLLATGHGYMGPHVDDLSPRRRGVEGRTPVAQNLRKSTYANTRYISEPYPLSRVYADVSLDERRTVELQGSGLTAIDHALYLAEASGGRFQGKGGAIAYVRSGREPSISMVSRSGRFPLTKPENYKSSPHDYYRPILLTADTVRELRESARSAVGGSRSIGDEADLLDFETACMPVIVTETAIAYYLTLYGQAIKPLLVLGIKQAFCDFLSTRHEESDWINLTDELVGAVESVIDVIRTALAKSLEQTSRHREHTSPRLNLVIEHWVKVIWGAEVTAHFLTERSPWGHSTDPRGNRFDWRALYLTHGAITVTDLNRDITWAKQGNLLNPEKAALDAVWRDCRDVLGLMVNNGGLTAESHKKFVDIYLRLNNRFVNGAAAIVMQRVCALMESKVLRVAQQPSPSGEGQPPGLQSAAEKLHDSSSRGWLVDARVRAFDINAEPDPLYSSLLDAGIVTPWTNNASGTFAPGYIRVTRHRQPVSSQGRADNRIHVTGAAAGSIDFFPFSLMRPDCGHPVMREADEWVTMMWRAYDEFAASCLQSQ
jgi:hypothetical protein